jgi:hypothetical protein
VVSKLEPSQSLAAENVLLRHKFGDCDVRHGTRELPSIVCDTGPQTTVNYTHIHTQSIQWLLLRVYRAIQNVKHMEHAKDSEAIVTCFTDIQIKNPCC